MSLPTDFRFSQGSLQDYVDCPRRFQLRHVRRLAWPALEVGPALESEIYRRQGVAFHRMIHQHLVGIPPERLAGMATDATLAGWWRNYAQHGPSGLPLSRYPEMALSAPVGGHRLMAKYDLVAVDAGQRAVIVDWKTYRKRPQREWLAGRLQTRVYPCLLVRAGVDSLGPARDGSGAGQSLEPERVEMVYWFANFPEEPERFGYDTVRYEADEIYLTALIEEIKGMGDGDFPLTDDGRRCTYCRYRSLCGRGVEAGGVPSAPLGTGEQVEDELALDEIIDVALDLEQIAEIEY